MSKIETQLNRLNDEKFIQVNLHMDYEKNYDRCLIIFKTQYDIQRREVIRRGIEDMTGAKYLSNNAATVFEVRKYEGEGGLENEIELIPEKLTFARAKPPDMRFRFGWNTTFELL